MNACGHHHVGHIGILGVDKHGKEWYQITLGGSAVAPAALGEVIGLRSQRKRWPIPLHASWMCTCRSDEGRTRPFLDTVRRIGVDPFRERVYETDHSAA